MKKFTFAPDTNNWWVCCILKGFNQEYEEEPEMYLVERNNPDYPDYSKCNNKFLNTKTVKEVLEDWDGSNWDVTECYSLEEAIEIIDGGCGINPQE